MRRLLALRQASMKVFTYSWASVAYTVGSNLTSATACGLPSTELTIRRVITSPLLLANAQYVEPAAPSQVWKFQVWFGGTGSALICPCASTVVRSFSAWSWMSAHAPSVCCAYAWGWVGYVIGALVVGAALRGGVVGLGGFGEVFVAVALGVGFETTFRPPQADAANRVVNRAAATAAKRRCMRGASPGEDRAGSVGGAPYRHPSESRTRHGAGSAGRFVPDDPVGLARADARSVNDEMLVRQSGG